LIRPHLVRVLLQMQATRAPKPTDARRAARWRGGWRRPFARLCPATRSRRSQRKAAFSPTTGAAAEPVEQERKRSPETKDDTTQWNEPFRHFPGDGSVSRSGGLSSRSVCGWKGKANQKARCFRQRIGKKTSIIVVVVVVVVVSSVFVVDY
jgi:hypothetical protein